MPNTLSSLDRPPLAEIAKRTAEAGGGLAAAAKAAAVAGFVQDQAAYRKRVQESYAAGVSAMRGELPAAVEPGKGEDVNLIVTGDLYGDEAVKALRAINTPAIPAPTVPGPPTPPPIPAVAPPLSTGAKWLIGTAIGAGLLGGIGGPWAVWLSKPATPPAPTTTTIVQPGTDYDVQKFIPTEAEKATRK